MTRAELRFENYEKFPQTQVEVETDSLKRPLLYAAGIIDLNHIFNQIPSTIVQSLGQFPNIDGDKYYPFMFDLSGEVHEALGIDEALPSSANQHYLYSLIEGGFIDQIAKTKLFAREFGIPQFGLRPYFPLPNPHNRGEHSIYTTINMVRSLQCLHDQNSKLFEMRLRKDFKNEPFYDSDIDPDSLFALSVDLAVLTGMEHDQATPAGGDTIKYLLKLHEEEDIEWLFEKDNPVLSIEKKEFLDLIEERGLGQDHLKFAIRCIQGKSNSLIGDMIHPQNGDVLDWDRISYTLLDSQMVKMLSNEIPQRMLPSKLTFLQTKALKTSLLRAVEVLLSNDSAVLGYKNYDLKTGENLGSPSTSFIDPTEDYVLDSDGNLVNTNPEKLAWIAAYRLLMIVHHYNGGKMLGFETKIQRRLEALTKKGIGREILNREKLITLTNDQLYHKLGQLGDPTLCELLSEIHQIASKSSFTSKIVDVDEFVPKAWARYALKLKPGLDTKVLYKHEVITLSKYLKSNPTVDPAEIISGAAKRYENKEVVIFEESNKNPIIRLG